MNKVAQCIIDKRKLIKTAKIIEEILNIKPNNFKELIFLKYIELENTKNVANYLNINNYRINTLNGSRKYISTDITAEMENDENYSKIDKRILFVALRLKKYARYLRWLDRMMILSDEYFKEFNKEDNNNHETIYYV